MAGKNWINGFSSGYIQRGTHLMPKQGGKPPWVNTKNYALDKKTIGEGPLEDGFLQFTNPSSPDTTAPADVEQTPAFRQSLQSDRAR